MGALGLVALLYHVLKSFWLLSLHHAVRCTGCFLWQGFERCVGLRCHVNQLFLYRLEGFRNGRLRGISHLLSGQGFITLRFHIFKPFRGTFERLVA